MKQPFVKRTKDYSLGKLQISVPRATHILRNSTNRAEKDGARFYSLLFPFGVFVFVFAFKDTFWKYFLVNSLTALKSVKTVFFEVLSPIN